MCKLMNHVFQKLFIVVYGGFSGVYTPVLLSFAFNFSHGIAYNPDGRLFMPFAIALLLAILTVDILIIVKTIKSNTMTRFEKILTILLFVTVKTIGLMVDQDGWRNFLHCFSWHINN